MRPIQIIRVRLSVNQTELALAIGVTRQNVSLYERGQTIPPPIAARLCDWAASRGLALTMDHVYGRAQIPREVTV